MDFWFLLKLTIALLLFALAFIGIKWLIDWVKRRIDAAWRWVRRAQSNVAGWFEAIPKTTILTGAASSRLALRVSNSSRFAAGH
jgi:hypothetical protein